MNRIDWIGLKMTSDGLTPETENPEEVYWWKCPHCGELYANNRRGKVYMRKHEDGQYKAGVACLARRKP